MGYRNDIFRKKYNELDKICKDKFNMFYDEQGKRESKSAIYEFAETLRDIDKDRLRNIIKLRNIIIHDDAAEVNDDIIKDVDKFIVLAKRLPKQNKTNNRHSHTRGRRENSSGGSYSKFYKDLYNITGLSAGSRSFEEPPTSHKHSGLTLDLDIIKLKYKYYSFETRNTKFTTALVFFDVDTKGNNLLLYCDVHYKRLKLSKLLKTVSIDMRSDEFGCLDPCTLFIVKKGLLKDIIYEVEFDPQHRIFQVVNTGKEAKKHFLEYFKSEK